VIEDEEDLALLLKKGLEEEGYSVDVCFDGEDGLFMASEIKYDAIILDIMLPKIDGMVLLKRLRSKGTTTLVLMLTARDSVKDKVTGLDIGADDYITKPFEFEELLARLRALFRRNSSHSSAILTVLDLKVNTATREVWRANRPVSLTPKEYAILEYLIYNKGRVITRTEITEHIYDESFDLDSNVIDVHINRLRKKIDQDYPEKLIHTVRGAGYILKER